jgi:outer membrane receptor for ferric coprogen and ferric-rhodotorulic acid
MNISNLKSHRFTSVFSGTLHASIALAALGSLPLLAAPAPANDSSPASSVSAGTGTGVADEIVRLDPVTIEDRAAAYIAPVAVASKFALPIREVPQSVSVITEARIKDQGIRTIVDAVNQVAGITIRPSRASANPTVLQSRGYTIGVARDGIPTTNTLYYSQLDLAFVEQLEVLRGSYGLFSGGGMGEGKGGTINIAAKHARRDRSFYAQASAGSWNNFRGEADLNLPLTSNGDLAVRVVGFVQDQDFFYDRTHATAGGLYGDITWRPLAGTTVSLSAAAQKDNADAIFDGIPRLASNVPFKADGRDYNPSPDWSYYNTSIREISLQLEQRLVENWTLKIRATHVTDDYTYHNAFAGAIRPNTDYGYAITSYTKYHIENEEVHDGVDIYLSGKFALLGREHTAVVGYNFSSGKEDDIWGALAGETTVPYNRPDLIADFGPADYDRDYYQESHARIRSRGIYAQTRLALLDPLHLVLGARVSDYRYTITDLWDDGGETTRKNETGEFTPYAALTYDLSKVFTAYASYADIFTPQTGKKYGGGSIAPGTNDPIKSGGSLDPAIGWQVEAGVKGEFFKGRLSASLALFRLSQRDKAFRVAYTGGQTYYLNVGEESTSGLELEIIGKLWKDAEVTLGYTQLDQQVKHLDLSDLADDSAAQNLTALNGFSAVSPEHQFKFWGVQRFELGKDRRLRAGLGLAWNSGYSDFRATTAATTQHNARQDGFALVNVVAGYDFNEHYRLTLNINNLFDKTYYENFSGWGDRFGEPRNIVLTFRYDY